MKIVVVAIYYHPEAYPPTLNAVNELSKIFDEVHLLYRPHLIDNWVYPKNVKLHVSGHKMTVSEQAMLPIMVKLLVFAEFCWLFLKLLLRNKPKLILVYDSFPLLAYHLFRKFLFHNHEIWYHNHDISTPSKYSIGWWANKAERKAFKYLNMFSLPAEDRKQYFNLKQFKGKVFFLPNYPSKSFYNNFFYDKNLMYPIKLIYQGSISDGHGFNEIMSFMSLEKRSDLNLILIGNIASSYKEYLLHTAESLNIGKQFQILEPVNYRLLPKITDGAHIGLAIHMPHNLIYATGGTASNKIYEYAAMGLPVLYYDNEHYKKYLSTFSWAVKCDLSTESILDGLRYIANNYSEISLQARVDFNKLLNFENYFQNITNHLSEKQDV